MLTRKHYSLARKDGNNIIMYTENTENTENTHNTRSYTVKEVSQLIFVDNNTVRRMIKDGRLDGKRVKGRYMITEESIKRLVTEGNKNK